MPTGEITWSTLATSSAGGTSETKFLKPLLKGQNIGIEGKNVIVVEVRTQSGPGSSDAGLICVDERW